MLPSLQQCPESVILVCKTNYRNQQNETVCEMDKISFYHFSNHNDETVIEKISFKCQSDC